jgi:hypothetical protein
MKLVLCMFGVLVLAAAFLALTSIPGFLNADDGPMLECVVMSIHKHQCVPIIHQRYI